MKVLVMKVVGLKKINNTMALVSVQSYRYNRYAR